MATTINNSWLVFSVTLLSLLILLTFFAHNRNDITLLLPAAINLLPSAEDLKTLDATKEQQHSTVPFMPSLQDVNVTIDKTKPYKEVVANLVQVCLSFFH